MLVATPPDFASIATSENASNAQPGPRTTPAKVIPVPNDVSPEMQETFAWTPFLVKDKTFNAFALPGGYIGVHLVDLLKSIEGGACARDSGDSRGRQTLDVVHWLGPGPMTAGIGLRQMRLHRPPPFPTLGNPTPGKVSEPLVPDPVPRRHAIGGVSAHDREP